MKIVQISHLYRPSIGGIENYSYRLTNSLQEAGHSVSIITTNASLSNDESPLSSESNVEYCSTQMSIFRNPLSLELYNRVRESDADLYHLHSPWYLSSLEAVLALPDDTPIVMTLHGFQPIQSRTAQFLDTVYRPFAKHILDRVDRTIVLGEAEKQRLEDEYDIPAGDVQVIPNGIHPDEHDVPARVVDRVRTKYGFNPGTPTILYVSRLVPLKNPRVLVDAVTDHLPDVDADIVMVGNGDGEYVDELQQQADDRFTFLSNLPFDDLQALYHLSDVFVLTSYMEGLPTVVLEAMNAQLPVITTPVGALSNVVFHREHGWLLECPPDERTLARAIRHYLDNPLKRRATGERNREYVRNQYDWTTIAESIESIYEETLGVTRESPGFRRLSRS